MVLSITQAIAVILTIVSFLAMTLTASNTSLVLVLLDANLRALGFVVHNLSLDGHLGQIGGGKGDLVTIDNEGDREFHGIALLSVETVARG